MHFYIQYLDFELLFNAGPCTMIKKDNLTIWVSGPKISAAQPMPDSRVPEPG